VKAETPAAGTNFLARNEFLIRRLHSLSGLIPVGAYMVIHLLTNASVLDSSASFQKNVYAIHSFGKILPVIEWVFIFIPILFHAIFGVVIIRGGLPNSSTYKYTSNVRYTLQRATGMIAFAFIMWHVFHMHGWFHSNWWMHNIAEPLGGGKFKAFNAASTGAEAMRMSIIVPVLYAIGVLSCVFHLANGIWTFGITWGLWVTPQSQRRANYACAAFGILLGIVGLSALGGFAVKVNVEEAQKDEEKMFKAKLASGEITEDEHKMAKHKEEPKETAKAEETKTESSKTKSGD
jgi:succinate dehydrogenase / fumarate reductase cytochrome b subunit